MTVRLVDESFDPWQELAAFERSGAAAAGRTGAAAVFVGTMRDFNDQVDVRRMYLEHYPGMTEQALTAIRARAVAGHGLDDALVVHRIGWLRPGEAIVLVAAWSAHRNAAFAACREMLEALKSRAPFWKKEELTDGTLRWVAGNTPAQPGDDRSVGIEESSR